MPSARGQKAVRGPQPAQTMRIVIKVGTSLIAPGGQIDVHLLRGLVDQFDLSRNEYLIVTSGAIAAGMSGLELNKRPGDIPRMQACAAVGQSKLMHTYERLFFGKKVVAQLLLSSDDFTSQVRYRNLQNALAQLLDLGDNVRHQQDASAIGPTFADDVAHQLSTREVQPFGRLVEHQQVRFVDQGLGHTEALQHTLTEARNRLTTAIGETETLQQRSHPEERCLIRYQRQGGVVLEQSRRC